MKRVIVSIAGTIAGLVALLSYKSHTGTLATPVTLPGASGPGGGGTSAPSTPGPAPHRSDRHSPRRSSTRSHSASHSPTSTYVGRSITTPYGVVQVKVTTSAGRIAKVSYAQLTAFNGTSQQINSYAAPILVQQSLSPRAHRSTVSPAPATPAPATDSPCRARSTRPGSSDRRRARRRPAAAARRALHGHRRQLRRPPPARRCRAARRAGHRDRARPCAGCTGSTRCSRPTARTARSAGSRRGELSRRALLRRGRARCSTMRRAGARDGRVLLRPRRRGARPVRVRQGLGGRAGERHPGRGRLHPPLPQRRRGRAVRRDRRAAGPGASGSRTPPVG